MYRPKIYTASKLRHTATWRSIANQYPEIEFTARWLDLGDGPDHNTNFWTEEQKTLHWIQDIQDVQLSDFVLVYEEGDDLLSGSIFESGAACALGKIVLAVNLAARHSWQAHPLVLSFTTIHSALAFVLGQNK